MTVEEILNELEALGTENTRKIYQRHCIEAKVFGVKYGDMESIVKRAKKHPELAEPLWETGYFETFSIATKIADVSKLSKATLNRWVKESGRVSEMEFAKMVAKSPHAVSLAETWVASNPKRSETKHIAGWTLIAALATSQPELENAWFEPFLERIESEIAGAANWVRYAMNNALIAIGGRESARLRDAALTVAKRIGKVEVDHGQTGCKTPDAVPYIEKIWARRKAKSAKKKTPKRKAGKRT